MAKRREQKAMQTSSRQSETITAPPTSIPSLPAAELFSFLKEIRSTQTWTEKDLSQALNIPVAQAKEAMAVLEMQGYIEPAGRTQKWRVTEQGDLVAATKSPRFTRESVEEALAALRDRIKATNDDRNAAYKVTEAVAFGDFLRDQARVQAADVGIELQRRADEGVAASAREHAGELAFLKRLRGKTALLHLQTYEEWMKARTHRELL
jgi:predicted ArsR family transcriptional regulator